MKLSAPATIKSPTFSTGHEADTPPSNVRSPSRSSSVSAPLSPLQTTSEAGLATHTSSPTRRRASLPTTTAPGTPRSSPRPSIEMQPMGSHAPSSDASAVPPSATVSPYNAPGGAHADNSGHASGMEAPPQAGNSTLYPWIAAGVAAGAELLASVAAIAAVARPDKVLPLTATSGSSWVVGAVGTALANTKHDKMPYVAAAINGLAGAADLATPLVLPDKQAKVASVSTAAWGVHALTAIGAAVLDTERHATARIAQGLSGVFNLGASAASAASIPLGAFPAGMVSAALWGGGAIAQAASSWADHRYSAANRRGDLEAGTLVNRPESAEVSRPGNPEDSSV